MIPLFTLVFVGLAGVVTGGFASGFVLEESERIEARRMQVEERFKPRPPGTRDFFASTDAIDIVLNPHNRVASDSLITSLTQKARDRLKSLCKDALRWELLAEWTKVRARLDEEAELFLVPVSERLIPLAAVRRELQEYPNPTRKIKKNIMSTMMEIREKSIVRVLSPFIRMGRSFSPQALDQVRGEITGALKDTFQNGAAVVAMLNAVEQKLARGIEPVPGSLRDNIAYVEAQIEEIEAQIQRRRKSSTRPS